MEVVEEVASPVQEPDEAPPLQDEETKRGFSRKVAESTPLHLEGEFAQPTGEFKVVDAIPLTSVTLCEHEEEKNALKGRKRKWGQQTWFW